LGKGGHGNGGSGSFERGNLTATTDDSIQPGTLWSASYDLVDRPQSTRAHYIPGAAAGIWVDQAWDRYGNLQSEGIRNASTGEVLSTSYAYDNRNRLSGATLPAGANVTITSNEADQRTNVAYPNGTNQGTTYLTDGNVDVITVTAPGGATLERWDYAYDAVSNVDTITTTQGVYDYGYDGLDRLTTGTYPAATGLAAETYSYDPLGNRELPGNLNAYQYDPNNRMTVAPGYYANTYDDDGSLIGRQGLGGVTVAAQYDTTNRPTAWATESLSLSSYLDYAHEPQGRRIRVHAEKVTGFNTIETTTYYLWAGDRIVAEYDVAGNRTVRYAYLPGDYSPIQQATATATTYLHSDRLQTPRRGTSTAGVVTWKGDYRSFGDGTPNTDPDGNGQAVVVKHRFPGQYADESGLNYNYYRDYDSASARYSASDPIGLSAGLNAFAYTGNNPLLRVDPSGLTWKCWDKILDEKYTAGTELTFLGTLREWQTFVILPSPSGPSLSKARRFPWVRPGMGLKLDAWTYFYELNRYEQREFLRYWKSFHRYCEDTQLDGCGKERVVATSSYDDEEFKTLKNQVIGTVDREELVDRQYHYSLTF